MQSRIELNNPIGMLLFVSWFVLLVQPILYIINVYRNTTVAKDQKALWVLLILFANFFVLPFYWYLHIWKDDRKIPDAQEKTAPLRSSIGMPRRRSKRTKLLLLAINFLPMVFILLVMLLVMVMLVDPDSPSLLTVGFLFLFSYLGAIVLNVVDVYRNPSIRRNEKLPWVLVLVFGNIIANLYYWYTHIWKEPQVESEITRETVITGG